MKTKYVKVPVSERLPEKEGYCSVIFKDSDTIRDYYHAKNVLSENFWKIHIEFWLEEVPDYSDEMLSMLENCRNALKITYGCNVDRIEELINKVKDNGK